MLVHLPPLPLVIDYEDDDEDTDITAEDEEAIILALRSEIVSDVSGWVYLF
jgi:hypothetical protein